MAARPDLVFNQRGTKRELGPNPGEGEAFPLSAEGGGNRQKQEKGSSLCSQFT